MRGKSSVRATVFAGGEGVRRAHQADTIKIIMTRHIRDILTPPNQLLLTDRLYVTLISPRPKATTRQSISIQTA